MCKAHDTLGIVIDQLMKICDADGHVPWYQGIGVFRCHETVR